MMQVTKERERMKVKKLVTKICEFCQKVFVGKKRTCSTSCANCLSLYKEF